MLKSQLIYIQDNHPDLLGVFRNRFIYIEDDHPNVAGVFNYYILDNHTAVLKSQ